MFTRGELLSVVLAVCLALLAGSSSSAPIPPGRVELFPYTPAANPRAVVVSGNARFTVLTDRVIRVEWSRTGSFENR